MTFGVRDSYVWRLNFLRLEVRDFYVWGLVFLRLRVRNFYVNGYFSYVWGLGILKFVG